MRAASVAAVQVEPAGKVHLVHQVEIVLLVLVMKVV
jgi:hypothetical protein